MTSEQYKQKLGVSLYICPWLGKYESMTKADEKILSRPTGNYSLKKSYLPSDKNVYSSWFYITLKAETHQAPLSPCCVMLKRLTTGYLHM